MSLGVHAATMPILSTNTTSRNSPIAVDRRSLLSVKVDFEDDMRAV